MHYQHLLMLSKLTCRDHAKLGQGALHFAPLVLQVGLNIH